MYKNCIARYANGTEGELYWNIRYPNWKLVSKNRKQWQYKGKKYKITRKSLRCSDTEYIDIEF
jgi:hypothetical protein